MVFPRPRPSTLFLAVLLVVAALLLVSTTVRAPNLRPATWLPNLGWTDTLPTIDILYFPAVNVTITAEVARSDDERSRGLSGRHTIPDGSGMLFVYRQPTQTAFWMKDTFVPLSIAFIDDQGIIIDIQDMQPLNETLHQSPRPYRYALEVPQGWFNRVGVVVGQPVDGLPHD